MKNLPYPDNRHLEAAEGWLGLGDHLAANEKLEHISPKLRTHPSVLFVRYEIYAKVKNWDAAVEIANTGQGSQIMLKPGIAFCFRKHYGLVDDMVKSAWSRGRVGCRPATVPAKSGRGLQRVVHRPSLHPG